MPSYPHHRLAAAVTLKIAYGYEVLEKVESLFIELVERPIHSLVQDDPLTLLAAESQAIFGQATQPGRFLVDVFPWLRFVPEWFPGAGWKKTAREWRQVVDRTFDTGYSWALEQIVRMFEET